MNDATRRQITDRQPFGRTGRLRCRYATRTRNVFDLTQRHAERYHPSGATDCVQPHRQIMLWSSQIIGAIKPALRGSKFESRDQRNLRIVQKFEVKRHSGAGP